MMTRPDFVLTVFDINLTLPSVGFSQADNPDRLAIRHTKHQHVQPFPDQTQRLTTTLGIGLSGIFQNIGRIPFEPLCIIKRKAMFNDVAHVLCWIEFIFHEFIAYTINKNVKYFLYMQ